ncbi:hypothetical protein ACF07K_42985, partial [Streptomyces sp. NPDC015350]
QPKFLRFAPPGYDTGENNQWRHIQAAAFRFQWTLSPFLVAASSGLGEEALASEASEAAAGDVDGRFVGGHAEEFVQLTGSKHLVGVLVEGIHDGLVGGVRLGWIGVASSGSEFGDDLGGGGQVRESRFGLGQGGGQVPYLVA